MSTSSEPLKIEVLPDDFNQYDISFKMIVIGDAGVGKSCLTKMASKGIFEEIYSATIGFEFLGFTVKINDKIIRLQIWDTCGQEIYRSIISGFYRNSSVVMLVYAINDKRSFININTWLDEIKCQTHPNLKIFLIGNKIDLEENRVIEKEKAEKFYLDHQLDFFIETSAKTGENAQKVFIKAAQILYDEYIQSSERDKSSDAGNKSTNNISLKTSYSENEKENDDDEIKRKKGCHC